MQNIADTVGVARSTVSLVLNGKEKEGRISEELADKIRTAAKRMNYQVNELARSLRTGYTHTIALVIADISDIFFGTLAYHLQEYAESKGYALIIVNTGEKKERLRSIFKMLINRSVDGIIMVPVANIKEGEIEQLNPDIPMVFIDRYFKELNTSRVIINNYEVAKTAAQLLIGKGCKKLAYISYREDLMHMQDRKRGFMDALAINDLIDEELICEADYFNYEEEVTHFIKRKIKEKKGFDGIFIAAGNLSAITISCLANMGIKPQADIQIISFGKINIATEVNIPYIRQPMRDICKNSFDILFDKIKNKNDNAIDCVLPASIIVD